MSFKRLTLKNDETLKAFSYTYLEPSQIAQTTFFLQTAKSFAFLDVCIGPGNDSDFVLASFSVE